MRAHLNIALAVALTEWRSLLRNRVARVAGMLLLALVGAASLVSHEQLRAAQSERARFQQAADRHWNEQPERHPHRVVHYGHYVFRPLSPLAFFDTGIDPYTGHTLFLEGHRQNSANFSEAVQSSVLLRFGQLTPAFVLQVVTPLLIVFLAFGSVAREREQGQLRLLVAQGARGAALVAGKLAAHGALALLLAVPAFGALAAIGTGVPGMAAPAAWMGLGYAIYLLGWSVLAVLVSCSLPRSRDALLVLAGCWIVTVVALPRVLPDLAARALERPTRIESEVAIARALQQIGDSHNPNDPHFAAFKARVLAEYGVTRVEDLPVNYSGLLMAEGERLTSELFERAMLDDFALQARQSALVESAAVVSPVIALRRLSMALAGTDGASHAHFLLDAERYRYRLIQSLNHLHATQVKYHKDKEQRLASDRWKSMPRFDHAAAPFEEQRARGVAAALLPLGVWIVVLAGGAAWVARRLDRRPA